MRLRPGEGGCLVSFRRFGASRSPAAVVESDTDDEDEAQFYAVEAPPMPRPGADRYGKPRLETLAVAEF